MTEDSHNTAAENGPEDLNHDRLLALFAELRETPVAELDAELDRVCDGDLPLREELASLLGHNARVEESEVSEKRIDALRENIVESLELTMGIELPEQLGDYAIESLIGEGGMGRVFAARQKTTGQRVALKVIRPGFVSASSTRRFRAEISFLGRLQHEGIARVYEAGDLVTEGVHQPFVAMEYVEGLDLRTWSRDRNLQERAETLIQIAKGIHHAHQRGVIHRDLKPANILVTAESRAKILDFGVARAIEDESTPSLNATMSGQLVGTLDYMSPEQIEGRHEDLGFASDIYALGVLAFEVLGHELPHDLKGKPLSEIVEIVCRRVARPLRSVAPWVPVALEQVVAKALSKSTEDRYVSAAAFAEDLIRWRNHRPVLARPPSTLQYLKLFAQRNPATSIAVPLLIAVLSGAVIFSTIFARRAADAQALAEANARATDLSAYRLAVSSVEAAIRAHDLSGARRTLESTNPSLRGWEWDHLRSRLDQSLVLLPTADGGRRLPKSPIQILNRGRRARVIQYEGSKDGAVFVTDIDLERNAVIATRQIEGIDTISTHERHLPAFAILGEDRLIAFDRDRGVVWEEAAFGSSTRREYALADMPVIASEFELEIREIAGIRVAKRRDGEEWTLLHDCGHFFTFNRCSPQGDLVATVGFELDRRIVEVFDRNTGRSLHRLQGNSESARSVAFRPDARRLLAAVGDGSVIEFDLEGQRSPRIIRGHDDRVAAAAYSPDGRLIVSGSQDATLRVWTEDRSTALRILSGHRREILAVRFVDENRLVSMDDRGEVRQWTLEREGDGVLRGHKLFVYAFDLSPDGKLIASGDWKGHLRIWDAVSGQLLHNHHVFETTERYDVICDVVFSPDGRSIVLTCGNGLYASQKMLIIDPETGETLRDLGEVGTLTCLAATTNPPRVVLTTQGEGRVFDPSTWKETGRFPSLRRGLAVAPSGDRFAHRLEGYERYLIRDVSSLEVLADLDLAGASTVRTSSAVDAVTFSPDGRCLVIASGDSVKVADIASGEIRAELVGHSGEVFSVAFSPDGRRLVSGADDRSIRLWDALDFGEVLNLRGHRDHVQRLAWSQDGERLYSCSGDYTLRIWDTLSFRQRRARLGR